MAEIFVASKPLDGRKTDVLLDIVIRNTIGNVTAAPALDVNADKDGGIVKGTVYSITLYLASVPGREITTQA
jgi:hypothetical protein